MEKRWTPEERIEKAKEIVFKLEPLVEKHPMPFETAKRVHNISVCLGMVLEEDPWFLNLNIRNIDNC